MFDETNAEWADVREELHQLLDAEAWRAARRTTINAHYTDPAIAQAMWQTLADLGFRAGRVLEPGAGAGTFIGLAPVGAELTGVELDPTTARIAQAIHPHATIRAESFAQTPLPDGYFDAAIGNVPFADVRLHDPRHNPSRLSLHNHFIVKALALVREGGLVAILTSHYTMDAHNPAARREIHQLGELLGAVRLPTGAHRRTAGTDALTDLLILRRRDSEGDVDAAGWETTRDVDVDGGRARINRYFAEHPERVLGELSLGSGMYGQETLHVRPPDGLDDLPDRLAAQLAEITALARAHDRTLTPRPEGTHDAERRLPAAPAASDGLWDGHLAASPAGTFTILDGGQTEPFDVARAHRVELRQLLELRDLARELLTAEAATREDTPELAELRGRLRDRYTGYVARYGPINRFTYRRTGHTDPETGEQRLARITPRAVQLLRCDPFAPLVRALEVFDDSTQQATPATLLSERVVAPRAPRLGADSPHDALAICLDTHGRVDLEEIASLLGQEPDEARRSLGELVYHDPEVGLVPAAEYLSGDVRSKLATARQALAEDPDLQINVAALERVLPADLGAEDVEPRLGAAWIDAATHQQFLAEILDDDTVQVEHPGGAIWAVRANNRSVRATSRMGHRPDAGRADRQGRDRAATDPGHRRDRRRRTRPPRREPDRNHSRPREGAGDAGALRGMVLGAARPRGPAARRVQPAVQQPRPARLHHRRHGADAPRADPDLRPATAPAGRHRSDHRRARRRAVSLRRRRQDRGDGDRSDGAPAPRTRPQTVRRGPQPHARAVQPRMARSFIPPRDYWPPPRRTSPATSGARSSPEPPRTIGTRS